MVALFKHAVAGMAILRAVIGASMSMPPRGRMSTLTRGQALEWLREGVSG